jgi:peptide deformylase
MVLRDYRGESDIAAQSEKGSQDHARVESGRRHGRDDAESARHRPGAPQVAQSVRLFVAELEENEEQPGSGKTYIIFNPEYVFKSDELADGVEGCLSIPGWAGEVPRHARIVVKGLDKQGQRIRIEAEGLLARVFQHELDHLDGVLFTDRISDPEKIWQIREGEEESVELGHTRVAAA